MLNRSSKDQFSFSIILSVVLLFLPIVVWLKLPKVSHQVWAFEGHTLPKILQDKGIFSDLDSQVVIPIPTWLPQDQLQLRTWQAHDAQENEYLLGLFYQKHLLGIFPLSKDQTLLPKDREVLLKAYPALKLNQVKPLTPSFRHKIDQDKDGVFDLLDIHIGALKTSLNAADYQEGYERLAYPLGDVSREIGVCTDVVVRAYRNAGWDLQQLLYEDMKKAPKAYGLSGKKPNRHIDHRRVRRLIVYFKRHFKSLPIEFSSSQTGDEAWLPGDLIFMDTFGKGRPTHVALVAGELGSDGEPLLINNWTYGYKTSPMSLRYSAKYMYRFRLSLRK